MCHDIMYTVIALAHWRSVTADISVAKAMDVGLACGQPVPLARSILHSQIFIERGKFEKNHQLDGRSKNPRLNFWEFNWLNSS